MFGRRDSKTSLPTEEENRGGIKVGVYTGKER